MMGRTPGGVLWNGSGQKYRTIARSPARYRGLVEQVYPGFVADPWAFSQRDFGTLAQMRRLRAAGRI